MGIVAAGQSVEHGACDRRGGGAPRVFERRSLAVRDTVSRRPLRDLAASAYRRSLHPKSDSICETRLCFYHSIV